MSWHDGEKKPLTVWEWVVMTAIGAVTATLSTMVILMPAYRANREELEAWFRMVVDELGSAPEPARPVVTAPPVIDTDKVVGEVEMQKPHFRPRVMVVEAPTLDPTAELNLKELSKYAEKVGTTIKDGKIVDVWKSLTHDETYYLPHRPV